MALHSSYDVYQLHHCITDPPPSAARGGGIQTDNIAIPKPIQAIPSHPPTPGKIPGEDYIPLETCHSGNQGGAAARPASSDQVEYDTPKGTFNSDNIYRSPPNRAAVDPSAMSMYGANNQALHAQQQQHDSVYKTPPKRDPPEYINTDDTAAAATSDDIYNVPTAHNQSVYDTPQSRVAGNSLRREPTERDSNSSNGSKHSHFGADDSGLGSSSDNLAKQQQQQQQRDTYKASQRATTSSMQDVYDYPPPSKPSSHPIAPPLLPEGRTLLESVPPPPRLDTVIPKDGNRAQYVNLNEPVTQAKPEPQYDIPPSFNSSLKQRDAEMLHLQPPVPSPCAAPVVTSHQYVNAGTGVIAPTINAQLRAVVMISSPQVPPRNAGARSVAQSSYLPMDQAASRERTQQQSSYLPMTGQAGTSPDSYSPMEEQHSPNKSSHDSYTPMEDPSTRLSYMPMDRAGSGRRGTTRNAIDSSYLPMGQQQEDYLPMDNNNKDRQSSQSTDSTYQILPPGIHPVSPNGDYDNRLSEFVGTAGRDSIYSAYPSNRLVEPRARGLNAYVPSSGSVTSSPALMRSQRNMNAAVSVRGDSDIYDVAPSNRPVPPPITGKKIVHSSSILLDQ